MPGQSSQWVATARVLRRAGFGVTGPEVDAAVRQDWPSYVDAMLGANPDADPGAVATPMPTFTATLPPGKSATPAARKQYNQQLSEQQGNAVGLVAAAHGRCQQPVHEKLTLLWHNHFATSAQKVRAAAQMAAQNQKLRTLSLGDFRVLAYAMLTDAAMLHWLDGQSNTAKAPNENLAREFMELFALGHGNGYTEDDVRAGARALTGWVIDPDGQTSMVPKRHDAGAKTLFGITRNFDAAGFCDSVLAQPKSAEYVAATAVAAIGLRRPAAAPGARSAGLGLRPRPQSARTDRGDPHRRRIHRRGAAPEQQGQHAGRMAGRRHPNAAGARWTRPRSCKMADATLRALGQRPFYPPSVGGWPRGQVWLSTASAEARLRAASRLAHIADLSGIESTAPGERIDAVGYLIGVGAWSDRTADALEPLVRRPPQLVAAAVNTPEYLTS